MPRRPSRRGWPSRNAVAERALLAILGATAATLAAPGLPSHPGLNAIAAFHVAMAGALLLSAVGRDALTTALRVLAAVMLAIAAIVPIWRPLEIFSEEGQQLYSIVVILAAAGYGRLLGGPAFYLAAAAGSSCWAVVYGGRAYAAMKRSVVGLDQIVLGLLFFALAAAISLSKAGAWPLRPFWGTRGDPLAAQVGGGGAEAVEGGFEELPPPG